MRELRLIEGVKSEVRKKKMKRKKAKQICYQCDCSSEKVLLNLTNGGKVKEEREEKE